MIKQHPAFAELVAAGKAARNRARRPGGRSAILALYDRCRVLEQQIMRDTGCTFNELTGAVLSA